MSPHIDARIFRTGASMTPTTVDAHCRKHIGAQFAPFLDHTARMSSPCGLRALRFLGQPHARHAWPARSQAGIVPRRAASNSAKILGHTKVAGASRDDAVKLDMSKYPPERIRNLSIIAHIDHGKSTLADRLLEMTGTIDKSSANTQVLDKLTVEKERGITVKAQTVSMLYKSKRDGHEYLINLIDTPGHVDFSYEVSRSLTACEGCLLLVDASQGIQAQTLSVYHVASSLSLTILPIINKIDLPHASPDSVADQIEDSFHISKSMHLRISAKSGIGVDTVLEGIVDNLPAAGEWRGKVGMDEGNFQEDGKLRALIIDTYYDRFRGVVSLVRVMSGSIRKGDKIQAKSTGKRYEVIDIGIQHPEEITTNYLLQGQVGYIVCNMKNSDEANVGDTIQHYGKDVDPLPGFQPQRAMVFAGIFPVDSSDFLRLEESVNRLILTDRSVSITRESSAALGQGMRAGFLGTLHMDVFRTRLMDEYEANVILTAPSVPYKVVYRDGKEELISNPADFPEVYGHSSKIVRVEEPMVHATIMVEQEYIGTMMELCGEHRGTQIEYKTVDGSDRAILRYALPLSEIVTDFFSQLKSRSSGYATFDYVEAGYEESDMVKLNLMMNGNPVDALAMIVHRSAAVQVGREWTKKLKNTLPRQQFVVTIQAAIGTKVIARETLSAFRKDVTAGLYGGHYERKMKHLEKQKRGKAKLKSLGNNLTISAKSMFDVLNTGGR